jgi:hypothetical protein
MNKIIVSVILLAFIFVFDSNGQNKKNDVEKSKTKTEKIQKASDKTQTVDKIIQGKKGPDGQSVYEGGKGGLYYINKNGNKTYLKDTDNLIAGKQGPEGEPVYKGSQGGEYYYNKTGVKTYLKK